MPTLTDQGTALQFDWVVEQNEIVTLRIPVLDENNAPFAVTGWTVDARVEKGKGGDALYTWSSGNASASGTNVTLTILPATSLAWTFRRGFYRVVIQHPSDATQRHRILEGRFFVSAE